MTTSVRTSSESKACHITAMGNDLGALYSALWQEVAYIHSKWDQYVILFGTKPERLEILNKAASSFFHLVQDTLWENVILHIARLTDSPQSVGKANLSIRRVPGLINDLEFKAQVELLVSSCVAAADFARDWRNRHLAHRDLERATSDVADPLAPASRAKVKTVLEHLVNLLNAISRHYEDSTTFFDMSSSRGNALDLLYVLDDGLAMQAARKERRRQGIRIPEDYASRNL